MCVCVNRSVVDCKGEKGKQRGGRGLVSLWHNGTATAMPVSTASLQTDLFFLFFSLSLSSLLLPPSQIRVFVAFISLALSFLCAVFVTLSKQGKLLRAALPGL